MSINTIAIAIAGVTDTEKATVDANITALDLPTEQRAYDASTVSRARDYIASNDVIHGVAGSDTLYIQILAAGPIAGSYPFKNYGAEKRAR